MLSLTVTSRETVRTVSNGISILFRNTSNKYTEQRRHRRCSDLLQNASLLSVTFAIKPLFSSILEDFIKALQGAVITYEIVIF